MAAGFRKSREIDFDGGTLKVREIGVDILLAAENGSVVLNDVQLIKECTGLEKDDVNYDGYLLIMKAIDELHPGVFKTVDKSKAGEIKKKVSTLVARLVTLGHLNCTDYGVSFFSDAINETYAIEGERVIGMANAVRVRNADKKSYEAFINSFTPKETKHSAEQVEDSFRRLTSIK